MKFTRKDLLENRTFMDPFAKTIITLDVTWKVDTGEILYGFNMKSHMPRNDFNEAMVSKNPGKYILEHYSKDSKLANEHLDYLSVDEALCLVNDSASYFFIPTRHRYYIEVCMKNIITDTDHDYIVQSKWFDTEAEAVAWYKNSFCYIDSKYCSAYLMTGQFYQDQDEEDYDIISSKKLENI